MTAQAEEKPTRTLLVERGSKGTKTQTIEVDVPANAKVTFGPLLPGKSPSYDDGLYLRIYVGTQQNQIAVIDHCRAFRDKDLPYRVIPEEKAEEETMVAKTLADLPQPKYLRPTDFSTRGA